MKRFDLPLRWLAATVALGLLSQAADAAALDGYQDRRGLFSGLGVGGSAAIQGGSVGGEAGFHAQIGGGATKRLTLALDIDTRVQIVDGRTSWMLVPGPQLDVFLLESLFVSAGVGLAFVFPDADLLPDKELVFGFDGMLGLGFEFFVGSDVAIDLGVEGDVIVIDAMDDAFTVGFWLGFRYY
jgi:hypothetical protein